MNITGNLRYAFKRAKCLFDGWAERRGENDERFANLSGAGRDALY